jgi:hypothetical protein
MRLLASGLIVGGAVLGGVFPGAVLALFLAAGSGLSGSAAERVCFGVNLLLALGGAFCGGHLARVFQLGVGWRYMVPFSALAGLIAGLVGYLWFDWVLSYANPPL